MKTLTDLIKIVLKAETLKQKISSVYGDGSIYINGEKLMLSDFGANSKTFDAALFEAREMYYEKEEEFQDNYGITEQHKVKDDLLNYIEAL